MDNLIVNKNRLKLLLTEKKDFIGLWKLPVYSEFLSSMAVSFGVITTEFKPILEVNADTVKAICEILCFALVCKSLFDLGKCFMKPYDHKELYKDISKLDEKPHCFSLVIIKDTFNTPCNKFLLQYVDSWKCKLFLYYRTVENDELHIKQQLSSEFGVAEDTISLEYKFHKEHVKFSVKENRDKRYLHTIYYASFKNMPKVMQNPTFEIQGKHYYWLNFNDMEKDAAIQKYNADIVKFVKEIIF